VWLRASCITWRFDWLLYKEIDDPVGAIPVHAFCGVAGTVLVMFAPGLDPAHPLDGVWWIQLIGISVAWALSYYLAKGCAAVLKRSGILQLGSQEEAIWTS